MRIHLADTSGDRGQYRLLAEGGYLCHLASYGYPKVFDHFEKAWTELVRLHFAGLPSSNPTICTTVLPEIQSHLTTYADPHEVKAKEQAFEMRIHLTDTTARLQGSQTVKRIPMEQGKPEALFSYAYNEQEEQWAEAWSGDAMKLYLAGYSGRTDIQEQVRPEHDAHLVTYAQQNQATETAQICDTVPDLRPRVIVDSGAFTAWSTGKAIRPQDYAEWALKFDSRWRAKMASLRYINLDYIPGTKGVSATAEQLKEATEKSMINADFLRASGLSPVIEVFHQDEPFELIKKLEDRRQGGCIALSPRNDVSVQKRAQWLTKVLHYCVKTFGRDRIPPAHGLAVTTEQLLKIFPFYSVDSSSWVSCLRFGEGRAAGFTKIPRYKESGAAMAATLHTLRAEIRKYQKMEQDMTKLWTLRGIEWNESEIR